MRGIMRGILLLTFVTFFCCNSFSQEEKMIKEFFEAMELKDEKKILSFFDSSENIYYIEYMREIFEAAKQYGFDFKEMDKSDFSKKLDGRPAEEILKDLVRMDYSKSKFSGKYRIIGVIKETNRSYVIIESEEEYGGPDRYRVSMIFLKKSNEKYFLDIESFVSNFELLKALGIFIRMAKSAPLNEHEK